MHAFQNIYVASKKRYACVISRYSCMFNLILMYVQELCMPVNRDMPHIHAYLCYKLQVKIVMREIYLCYKSKTTWNTTYACIFKEVYMHFKSHIRMLQKYTCKKDTCICIIVLIFAYTGASLQRMTN